MQYLLLLFVFSLLIGCSSTLMKQQTDRGIPIAETWSVASVQSGPVEGNWWATLGDPNLEAVVAEALARNYDLQAAAARLAAAAAEARIAGADVLPRLELSLTDARQQQNLSIPIPGAKDRAESFISTNRDISLSMSWEVDLWGRIRAGKAAALANTQAAQAELNAAYLSLAARTAKAWFAVTEARLQIDLARVTIESYRTSAELARTRFERGVRPSLDLRLSLSNLAAAEALLEQRQEQFERDGRQLEVLVGRYPAGALSGAETLPPIPAAVPAGLPAELLARRPDLIAAERRLAAADARITQARAALYPRISLTASGGTASEELHNLLNGHFLVWSLANNLMQPVFEGGRLRAEVDLAEAGSRQALAAYAHAVLNALTEVESALAAEAALGRREADLVIASEQAKAARGLAEEQYRLGLEGFITVLETNERTLTNESQLLAVRRQRLDNRVDLYLALGGGFEPRTPH